MKLTLPPEAQLPPIAELVAGTLPSGVQAITRPARVLDAQYWDTPDLRLIRSGVTLRHRTKDGDRGEWTVKVPSEVTAIGALVRSEINMPGAGGTPPREVERLVVAHARSAKLVRSARLRTTRTVTDLSASDGTVWGEIDDDVVDVIDGESVTATFRELELEVAESVSEQLLEGVVGRLRSAGAGEADPTPKVMHALGRRARRPPDLLIPAIGADASLGEVVAAALAASAVRMVAAHHGVCVAGDATALRVMRASARRSRCLLRVFAPALDADWATSLGTELRWLGEMTRVARSTDALLARLTIAGSSLGDADDHEHADALLRLASRGRTAQVDAVVAQLDSDRYRWLLEQLVAGVGSLPASDRARRPAAGAGPHLVRVTWRELRGAVAAVTPVTGSDPDSLRRVRSLARRVRVGSEALVDTGGPGAQRLAVALGDLGDAAGVRHDASVACAWLRDAASRSPRRQALVAGLMLAHEQRAVTRAERRWREAWGEAERRRSARWLD